jgi:cell shape-determining protein MreD
MNIGFSKPHLWLGLWGGFFDVYKCSIFGPYFSGFLAMTWVIAKIKQKIIWRSWPIQVIATFIVILFLYGWYYGWILIFDLNRGGNEIKEFPIFSFVGAVLAPFVFKSYNILIKDAT